MDTQIHVYFIPFLARGHTIPLVDTARLFARRGGVRCTIVTTPGNSTYIRGAIEQAAAEGLPVDLELVPFPAAEAGLPAGVECTDALPDGDKEAHYVNLYRGMFLLRRPIERLVAERRPDCIVSDSLLYWTTPAFARSLPLFQFAVFSPFSKAVFEAIYSARAVGPASVGPLPGLPHELTLDRAELPNNLLDPEGRYFVGTRLAEDGIRGIMFNSFDELSPEYDELCRKSTLNGRPLPVWCIGPVQLRQSGHQSAGWAGASEIKEWLDSKPPESVLYVSFGSECVFGPEQLREIAAGLMQCKSNFIWVVRRGGGGGDTLDEWLPEGFRNAVGDRGMILTEWAPQVEIMNHGSAGGCIVHCGWNSCVETMCAGLPVVAWPLHSEQFVSERFVVEVVKTGVRILEGPGMRSVDRAGKGTVRAAAIRDAVDRLMGGGDEEARAARENARRFKGLARAAMEVGGSSYENLSNVIEQMRMLVKEKK